MEKQQVISEIDAYIRKNDDIYSNWYVGIASDVRKRLFSEHNVDEKNDNWIYRTCENSNDARDIELYFINTLGTSGGSGGGDSTTIIVYAYKKSSHSNE